MLLAMPGVPFIYYGDEIGMRTVEGLPSVEGAYDRSGIRTPMQWDASPSAGFSAAPASQFYLALDPDPARPNVASQQSDPDSLLAAVRQLVRLRHEHPALQASADFKPIYAEAGRCPFVFLRTGGGERILAAINPSGQAVEARGPGRSNRTGWCP